MVERNYLRVTGASITAPTSYRTFKPYIYRGAEPWTPPTKPENHHTCETTGKRATTYTYRQHLNQGEPACTPCQVFSRLLQRRSEQHRTAGVYCEAPKPCSAEGYTWHQNQGEPPCPECTRYHQKENPQ